VQVIANLGLAVSVYDILDIQGGLIYPSDGAAHFKAKFRLIFFRPFVGEVLTGRLVRSDR
jgi:DNA-directed RNA polymerase subunit E'/Rpb7